MQPTKIPPVPLAGNTGVSASYILNSRKNDGSCFATPRPSVGGLYVGSRESVKRLLEIFCNCRKAPIHKGFEALHRAENFVFAQMIFAVFDYPIIFTGGRKKLGCKPTSGAFQPRK
jgi:hypothetical protein